jgi:hypothetical protein
VRPTGICYIATLLQNSLRVQCCIPSCGTRIISALPVLVHRTASDEVWAPRVPKGGGTKSTSREKTKLTPGWNPTWRKPSTQAHGEPFKWAVQIGANAAKFAPSTPPLRLPFLPSSFRSHKFNERLMPTPWGLPDSFVWFRQCFFQVWSSTDTAFTHSAPIVRIVRSYPYLTSHRPIPPPPSIQV